MTELSLWMWSTETVECLADSWHFNAALLLHLLSCFYCTNVDLCSKEEVTLSSARALNGNVEITI